VGHAGGAAAGGQPQEQGEEGDLGRAGVHAVPSFRSAARAGWLSDALTGRSVGGRSAGGRREGAGVERRGMAQDACRGKASTPREKGPAPFADGRRGSCRVFRTLSETDFAGTS